MKKLVMLFVLTVASSFAFSQDAAAISVSQLKEAKSKGIFEFTVPENITEEQVNAAKGYYTTYFTVTFDEATDKLKVVLTSNEALNIQVVNRLLVSLNLKSVNVDGKEMTYQEVMEKYLN